MRVDGEDARKEIKGLQGRRRTDGDATLKIDEGKAPINATQSRLVRRWRTSEPNKTREAAETGCPGPTGDAALASPRKG